MDIRSIIETENRKWNQAFNAGDVTTLASFYVENAMLSPGNGNVLHGRLEVEGLFKGFIEAGVNSHTLEAIEVGGADNIIYQVARWAAKGKDANGGNTTFGGITTSVLKQDIDGRWLVQSHVWNTSQ
jgi:ketosteroid isomerase-like protein